MNRSLTRRQQEIYDFLSRHNDEFEHPPTLDELCSALGLSSKGSLHKQIQALVDAGLVEPMNNQRRGVRLVREEDDSTLPVLGYIAAGKPIEAIEQRETIQVPSLLRTNKPCFVLQVRGDSMIEEGILDGDHIIVEQRDQARNGEIVVALIDGSDATLKRIEQTPGEVILHPANSAMSPLHFSPDQVSIQGVLVGQMRSYH
ncbi:MAG: transcriptional repressor LexA [Chromatiaceae bacterium]|nr:transcriptional repressor LexA [Gammaproteobacteria bacterium]MCP5427864.1 transcriptional repressor LexA [Chromatiaceae bacterium]MCB1860945.1 transcriptional repressor LexA [Gammaproteobacteria bacterium]MCB1874073.1 transcriptional repressor LexA [Gammaproteobacteria bacterium]MCB1880165.1 transcriptional repressor LexA [Gammaproteobacteria bacterium]